MKYLFIFLVPLSLFANLESRITSKAQELCAYFKNPNDGLSPQDYTPVITNQTLRQTSTVSDCNDWNLDPYVNVDTEDLKVIADMSCNETTDANGNTKAEISQYALDVNCQTSCEIPRDSNQKLYEKVENIEESDCTNQNLQIMLDNYYPNQGYVIDDTQYLTCSTNVNLTGCYLKYHVGFDGNTDTNETNTSNDLNITPIIDGINITNQKLDVTNQNIGTLNNSIQSGVSQLKGAIGLNGIKLDDIKSAIGNNTHAIDMGFYDMGIKLNDINRTIANKKDYNDSNVLDKLDTLHNDLSNTHDYTDILGQINSSVGSFSDRNHADLDKVSNRIDEMSEYMKSGEDNTEATDTMNEAKNQAKNTVSSLTSSLNKIISNYTGTAPIITGTGTHIFTASVYKSSVTFDLSMFVRLRPTFDIFWLLLLAYLNFKIYSVVIRDLLKKI